MLYYFSIWITSFYQSVILFEIKLAKNLIEKNPLAPIGVLTPGSAHTSALLTTPIDMSGRELFRTMSLPFNLDSIIHMAGFSLVHIGQLTKLHANCTLLHTTVHSSNNYQILKTYIIRTQSVLSRASLKIYYTDILVFNNHLVFVRWSLPGEAKKNNLKKFRSHQWVSSLPGLCTLDPLLGPPSTWGEIFRGKCLQSHLQASPLTLNSFIRTFRALQKNCKIPSLSATPY